jgi:hypothetical protein
MSLILLSLSLFSFILFLAFAFTYFFSFTASQSASKWVYSLCKEEKKNITLHAYTIQLFETIEYKRKKRMKSRIRKTYCYGCCNWQSTFSFTSLRVCLTVYLTQHVWESKYFLSVFILNSKYVNEMCYTYASTRLHRSVTYD